MNFSVCLIARNEEKTIPRLAASLREFEEKGGEILLLDTGSTDKTVAVAKELGLVVHEVGDMFRQNIGAMANQINKAFNEDVGEIVKREDSVFNYSAARNYVASLASNDMIAMPDCDEVYTKLDLEAVQRAISEGAEQLEYNFVFCHDEFGNEAIKFAHCKFYNRKKLQWVGIIHEVLQGNAKRVFLEENIIKLEHFQNKETNRSSYLTGLALDCFLNPENDRNSHYFGRELLYTGRYKSAMKELKRHLTIGKWAPERSQSMIFIGDCYLNVGDDHAALEWWNKAFSEDSSRREPFARLAWYFYEKGDRQRTIAFCEAMLTIPWNAFYANNQYYYTAFPHELLYWAYWGMDNEKSKYHFDRALFYQPQNPKYLADKRFYYKDHRTPPVSVIIPTKGRPEKLRRLLDALEKCDYPEYEVLVIHDGEPTQDLSVYGPRVSVFDTPERLGVPKVLKDGVAVSKGELVFFLGNDCIPEPDFITKAVDKMYQEFGDSMDGLIAVNDGYWNGEIATHWLASKKLLPFLDGEFFHTGYNHVGCDNELTARCKKMGKYAWAEDCKVFHDHPIQGTPSDEIYDIGTSRQKEDRELLEKRSKEVGFELLQNFIHPNGLLPQ